MLTQCWRRVVQWNCSFFFRAHKSLSYWTDHQLFKLMTKVVPSWPPWPQGQNKPLPLKIDPPGPPGGVLEKFTQFFKNFAIYLFLLFTSTEFKFFFSKIICKGFMVYKAVGYLKLGLHQYLEMSLLLWEMESCALAMTSWILLFSFNIRIIPSCWLYLSEGQGITIRAIR